MLGIGSCSKDYLELDPSYAISAESAFSDSVKIQAFITGLYDNHSYYYYTQSNLMEQDIRGNDIFLKASGNYGRFDDEYMYSVTTDHWQVWEIWAGAYSVIANCNQVTENMPGTSFSSSFKSAVIAEARAIRATAYLTLAHLYCQPYGNDPTAPGIPITNKPVNPDPPEDWPDRGTVEDVYTQILDDLLYAEANLPATKTDITRMTPNVVKGLLARTYLDMENWTEARDNAIEARTGYPLASSAELLAGFADATSEWIWSLDMRSDDNNGYLMLPSFYDNRVLGYSSFRATNDFVAEFELTDDRVNMFDIPRDGGMGIIKYLHRGAWDMDQVLMRSAEMYLIEAEANANIPGQEAAAITALNAVQNRVNATPSVGLTGQALLDAIALERRKELFGEGFHVWDMLRRGEGFTRTDAAHWAPVTLTAYDPMYLFPIPQDEIDANPNISESDQNEGY